MDETNGMVERRGWNEFRETGLLWLINSILHLFGWAIVAVFEDPKSEPVSIYPARVRFRGFSQDINDKNYIRVTKYMHEQHEALLKEVLEEQEEEKEDDKDLPS